jgi:hypothetical protein
MLPITSAVDLLPYGKGVYIWLPEHIENGDPERIAQMMVAAGVDFVLIKIHDGVAVKRNLAPVIHALRACGIIVSVRGLQYTRDSRALCTSSSRQQCTTGSRQRCATGSRQRCATGSRQACTTSDVQNRLSSCHYKYSMDQEAK